MRQSSLVPDSEEVTVESVMSLADGQFLLVLRAASGQGFCPRCQRLSLHIHSHYLRLLSDLPWEGIPVHIQLHVRRFFCRAEDCEQAIFTERLPHTVLRYARRTCRLSKTIRQITMALGGEVGRGLARQLGINASGDTFLRELRRQGLSITDRDLAFWVLMTGHGAKVSVMARFSADLEQSKVIDLLPERSEGSTEDWIRIIQAQRSSAVIEQACMQKQPPRPRHRPFRSPIVGTYCII